jgi:xanthine dehydrogenase YagR molybdenum-binding subunit
MSTPTPTTAKKMKKIRVPRVVDGYETMVEIEVEDTGETPTWGPNNAHRLLNSRQTRVDAPAKVTGTARYTHDVRLSGMLYGRVLLSPYARARIKSVDVSHAQAIPGVKAIEVDPNTEIYHAGQAIAAVAAVTLDIAEDAVGAIRVDYEVLPHVVRAEDAVQADAPRVMATDPNVEPKETKGDAAGVDAALAACDAVVEADYKTPIVHHCCFETHGVVVDVQGGKATVYASTQGVFAVRGDAIKALELPDDSVAVIDEYMGGGFGAKFGFGAEGKLACALAKKSGAPVHMMLTRRDEFTLTGNRSGSWQTLKGGATRDGRLRALRAYQRRLGGLSDGSQATQPYVYTVENAYAEVVSIHTHETPSVAMRAPGNPQSCFAIEMLVDELAHKIEMDPVEFRKKNLGDPAWHRQLDRGAREIGWSRRNPVPGGNAGPLKRGMGCAVGAWPGGGRPQCIVTVEIGRDGVVHVLSGTQDLGTGTRTYVRAIVAEELGLTMSDVVEKVGDSRLGAANASGGSTTAPSLSPAVKDAAVNARRLLAEAVAPIFKVTPDDVTFAGGSVSAGSQRLAWAQACAALGPAGISARGEWKMGLSGSGTHGACFAEVEVDVETGQVRPIKMVHVQDCGLPLNRLTLVSQMNGGMLMGLGYALWETGVNDSTLGIKVNPSFQDYKFPGSLEIPELVALIDDDDPRHVVVGIGEPVLIPSTAAVINAIYNACGVRVREIPATPDKILMALAAPGRTA